MAGLSNICGASRAIIAIFRDGKRAVTFIYGWIACLAVKNHGMKC